MEGRLTFLGTGTSMGVPTLGCGCAVCTSADPHDRRLRPSALVRWREPDEGFGLPPFPQEAAERMGHGAFSAAEAEDKAGRVGGRERVVVIDTGPDFREQALR